MGLRVQPRNEKFCTLFSNALDDPAEWAHDRFDPHMARFRDNSWPA